jgi:integrase
MNKEKTKLTLTDTFIKGKGKRDKRIEYYDDNVTGLILRVTKTGYKSFALRYWYDGKSKQITIGKYGDYTLAEARSKAKEIKKIITDGKDPLLEREIEREHKPVTLAEYVDQFKNDYVERKLKSSTQKTYKSRLNKILNNKIAKLPLKDVSRSDVRKFLKAEAKEYPTNANRLHSILSKIFNEAINDELLTKNPIKDMEKISDENKRDPHYSNKDIQNIWDAIGNEWQPMQGLLKMLLITGQRLGETSRMKWADVHNNVWIIPISEQKTGKKTKKNHKVPLSASALEVLENMKPINGTSEYIFASQRDKKKTLSHFKNAIDRIRKQTKINDFRIHDLRHIVATEMIKMDVPFTTVGRVLNHKALAGENTITARYVNTDLSKQKTIALNSWANELNRIVTGEGAKIHELKKTS